MARGRRSGHRLSGRAVSRAVRDQRGKGGALSACFDWGNRFWVSESFADFQKTAQKLFDDKHLRLVHVEMLE